MWLYKQMINRNLFLVLCTLYFIQNSIAQKLSHRFKIDTSRSPTEYVRFLMEQMKI